MDERCDSNLVAAGAGNDGYVFGVKSGASGQVDVVPDASLVAHLVQAGRDESFFVFVASVVGDVYDQLVFAGLYGIGNVVFVGHYAFGRMADFPAIEVNP